MKRGFIKISIFLTIIAVVLIISGGGYVGVKQYQQYQKEKSEKEILLRQREEELQESLALQQKALEDATSEIEKLKEQSEESQKKQVSLEAKLSFQSKVKPVIPKDYTISAEDLAPYLDGVVQLSCGNSSGSASLWNIKGIGYVILTNYHVIEDKVPYPLGQCSVTGIPPYMSIVNVQEHKRWNLTTDIAILPIEKVVNLNLSSGGSSDIFNDSTLVTNTSVLNYKIGSIRKCLKKMPIGTPVTTIGFPVFGIQNISILGVTATQSSRITSDGIVSGYDESKTPPVGNLSYVNYFVSNKIDSGSSGGIALAKDENGLCVLGVPTWLTVGNYETQGLVQNIHNVLYQE